MPYINFQIPLAACTDSLSTELSHQEIDELITQAQLFIKKSSIKELQNSTCVYWLTHAAHCAIKQNNISAIQSTLNIFLELAKSEPIALTEMISQTIPEGELKGLQIAYLWMNDLYLSVFNPKDSSFIISMENIFSTLLRQHNVDQITESLVRPITGESPEQGKHALMLLAQSLLAAIKGQLEILVILKIAGLLKQCFFAFPKRVHLVTTEDLIEGPLAGKSVVYMLVSALKEAKHTHPAVTPIICGMLENINETHPKQLLDNLSKLNTLGPYKGQSPLHMISTALITAASIDHNEEVVTSIVNVIQRIVDLNPKEQVYAAFQMAINYGPNTGLNGQILLERAAKLCQDNPVLIQNISSILEMLKQVEIESHNLRSPSP